MKLGLLAIGRAKPWRGPSTARSNRTPKARARIRGLKIANLDPTGYYDVYVTWSPLAGASTAAQYTVIDYGITTWSGLPTVNQTLAPADYQAAGAFWHDLGVYQATSGTLVVQLGTDGSGEVLADAAMIVPETTAPVTNLTMNSFAVDGNGNFSVTYTIAGEDSPPFSIGVYGSPDGVQPATLLQTYDVTDPSVLGGGGQTYTVSFAATQGQTLKVKLSGACRRVARWTKGRKRGEVQIAFVRS